VPCAVVGVLGFEEKFLARCMMRVHGGGGLSRVVLFVPSPSDDYSSRRSEEAFRALKKLAEEYMGAAVERVVVDPADFWGCVSRARSLIMSILDSGVEKVFLCIASGMRALVAALIVAALTLPRDYDLERVVVQGDLESGTGMVEFAVSQVRSLAELTSTEERVLKLLSEVGELRLSDVARRLELPKSTVWRTLVSLERKGLVEKLPQGLYRAKVRL